MNDLISKKALLEEIEAQYDLSYGAIMINPRDFYDMADCQKVVQQANKWIPVSERLPEKRGVYLATFLEEGKRYVERFYYSDFTGWMMPIAWQDEGRIENILAWQPLPEPYKGGNYD